MKFFSDNDSVLGMYRVLFASLALACVPFFIVDVLIYGNPFGFLAFRGYCLIISILAIWLTYVKSFSHKKISLVYLLLPFFILVFVLNGLINPHTIDSSVYLVDTALSGLVFAFLVLAFPSENKYKSNLFAGLTSIFIALGVLTNRYQPYAFQDKVSYLQSVAKRPEVNHLYDKLGMFVLTSSIIGITLNYRVSRCKKH